MATPGRPLDQRTRERVQRLRNDAGLSIRKIAAEERLSTRTVQKICKKRG